MRHCAGRGLGAVGAIAVALLLTLAMAPWARAVDIIESQEPGGQPETDKAGWQAGTCSIDTPPCSAETPGQFFTQAAGHPPAGFTQIIVKHDPVELGPLEIGQQPVGTLKTVLVDLPPGLSVNPQATVQCPKASPGECAAGYAASQVGVSTVTASVAGVVLPAIPAVVYNMAPREGEPARFGFTPLPGTNVFLNAGVAWEGDYHEYFTIHVAELPISGAKLLINRLVFDGSTETQSGGGRFLTNPSTCEDSEVEPFKAQYTTYLHADSYDEEAPEDGYDVAAPAPPSQAFLAGSQKVAAPLPKGARPDGCGKVPFAPSTSAQPSSGQTDSPAGATVNVDVPFSPAAAIYQSNVRVANVSLPPGMGLNPAAAPHLQACSDAQFGEGTRSSGNACPPASKIGTVSIETPVLPGGTLTGSAYLGVQKSRDPESGEEFRVLLEAGSAARGVTVRLLGHVKANTVNGQLTAVVDEAPQVPFSRVQVKLDGGSGAVLTNPPTCGPNATSHAMSAWSGTPDSGPADKGFTLSSAPGGGSCAKTLAERPFAPGFAAAPESTKAHAYTPLHAHISRSDGEQELKGVDITLPRGATAKLKGIPYCSPQRMAVAASSSAAAELADPGCPAKSLLGSVATEVGSGPSPLHISGKAYLSGPYRGAPLSLAIVTPAAAGPFDLGTVVVRVALFLDPRTARIHAVSDPIPDVFGGVKLDIRSVDVDLNRKGFALNGTNCRKQAMTGALNGGGGDPANPAAFSSFPVSVAFQATQCRKLAFKPKLHLRLFGDTGQAQHPRLRAVLVPRGRDANLWHAVVSLPHAIFLDQGSLASVCTRPQFDARTCPKKSIYGHAKAFSPLLGKPLKGPVYLRASGRALPDMVAALRGQVNIELSGKISSARGGIRTSFGSVPDVPVSKFILNLPGGRHGLLVASRDLCRKPVVATIGLKGQNGKRLRQHSKLRTPCPQGRRKHRP